MTPKEKAQELIDKFKPYMYPFGAGSAYLTGDTTGNNVLKDAKECALFHVEEILKLELIQPIMACGMNYVSVKEYYKEVKNEIEKL